MNDSPTLKGCKSFEQSDSRLFSFDDSILQITLKASEELLCGCECDKKSTMSRYCQNAQKWLTKFYQDKFNYIIYAKTYEGFLQ